VYQKSRLRTPRRKGPIAQRQALGPPDQARTGATEAGHRWCIGPRDRSGRDPEDAGSAPSVERVISNVVGPTQSGAPEGSSGPKARRAWTFRATWHDPAAATTAEEDQRKRREGAIAREETVVAETLATDAVVTERIPG